MKQKKSEGKSIADVEKLYYPSLLLAHVQRLRIGNIDPNFYFLDGKVKYVSLDEFIKTGVLAAWTNQPKPTLGPFKEQFKRILRHNIEKKNNYVVSKNMRFGEWQITRNTFILASTSTFVPTWDLS